MKACIFLATVCVAVTAMPPDPLANPGFQHFYNLEYDEALAAFEAQSAKDPESPEIHNYIATAILFRQMFRTGALGSDLITAANSFLSRPKMPMSAADQKLFADAVTRAIALAEARLKNNPKDAAAMYSLGVSHGVRANYNFMMKKWVDALSDASAARKLHARVLEMDPNFHDARLIPGADDYVIGSLPWGWKMIGAVAGFRGDRERGIQMLKTVAQSGRYNRFDAEALLAAVYRREKRPAEAIAPLSDLIRNFPRSYILRIELAEMYGDMGERAKALAAVDQMEEMRQAGAPGYQQLPEAKIHAVRGGVWMQLNDLDKAREELQAATANTAGMDAPSAGRAWLRLGEVHDLQGRRQQAMAAYQQAMRAAPGTDAAEQAKTYAATKYTANRGR